MALYPINVGSTLYEKVLNDFGDILFTLSVLFLARSRAYGPVLSVRLSVCP